MNLRDLQYLIAVVKHKSFSKAAEACYVTQPTLSAQLKKLEDELGIILFERDKRNVRLTREGDEVLAHAEIVCREAQAIKSISQLTKDPYVGELHIGVIPTSGPYLLPHLLSKLKKQLPKMTIWWYEKQTNQLLKELHEGKIDAAILALPVLDKNLENKKLFDEEFLVAIPKKWTLAKNKSISPSDLASEKILLLEEGHCLRDQALSVCHQADLPVIDEYRATSLETLRAMVASGTGISLFPALATATTHKDIIYLPMKKDLSAKRTMGLVYKKNAAQKRRIEMFYETIKNN